METREHTFISTNYNNMLKDKLSKRQIEKILRQPISLKLMHGSMKTYVEIKPKKNHQEFDWSLVRFLRNLGFFGFYSVSQICIHKKYFQDEK